MALRSRARSWCWILAAAWLGCGGKEHQAPVTDPARRFFYEAEFSRTRALSARSSQVVIHDLEPTSGPGALAENLSHHRLEDGTYRFCVEPGDRFVKRLIVEDDDGNVRAQVDASTPCADLRLQAGTYQLRTFHDGSAIHGAHRVGFVHRKKSSPLLGSTPSVPQQGFWALAPDDPTGQQRPGVLRALPPDQNLDSTFYPQVEPIVADFSSKLIDARALFNFESLGGDAPLGNVPYMDYINRPLDITVDIFSSPSSSFVLNTGGLEPWNKFGINALQIVDLGNMKVQLQEAPALSPSAYTGFFIDTDSTVKWGSKPASASYMNATVLFRAFPIYPFGANVTLQEGEIGVFTGCNYQGPLGVFVLDTPDLTAFSTVDAPVATTGSVKVGPNTGVILYSGPNYTGSRVVITADTPCLSGTPVAFASASLEVEPQLQIFLATSTCESCNLAGVDLTGTDLSGVDLQGTSLAGAILTNVHFNDAVSLAGTDFSGATLFCTDLSGSPGQVVDLTQTTFTNAKFKTDFSCRANFSYTHVTPLGAGLDPQVWRYLDLTGAILDPNPAGPASLDLSQGMLPGATFQDSSYPAIQLTNANLAGADLTGTYFQTNLTDAHPVLAGATLDGVIGFGSDAGPSQRLFGANFSGASLQCLALDGGAQRCVDLSGADLRGASFVGAVLTGANLTGAVLQSGTFTGPPVQFVDAGLTGVQGLTGANLQGVDFAGAILDQLDLSGAQLGGTNFTGASLQGVTLAAVQNLPGATLTGANFTGAHFGDAGVVGLSAEKAILDSSDGLAGVDLTLAAFNGASLVGVDLSGSILYGAHFNNANLENASLAGAFLSNNPPSVQLPADFSGAHLKDVNLSAAQLSGTIFKGASIYGSFNSLANGPPRLPCVTNTNNCGVIEVTGYTCSCASFSGAVLTRTNFNGAFLYGADFSGSTTTINGADFTNAILVGASFASATFQVDPSQGGAQPVFEGAWLQGTDLQGASLDSTTFEGAFFDFQPGNQMQVLLPRTYTNWPGWEAPDQPVCVQLDYSKSGSIVPVTTSNTTCPDGLQHLGGCGPTPPLPSPNPNWQSNAGPIGQATPPGFYLDAGTYDPANQTGACNLNTANFDW